jgi:hypothetical protein
VGILTFRIFTNWHQWMTKWKFDWSGSFGFPRLHHSGNFNFC